MDFGRIICAALGFSASFFLFLPSLRKWQNKQMTTEKLKMVSQALQRAEESARMYQERHDRLLNQICSHYLVNQELQEALTAARDAMHEALAFAVVLRNLKMETITSFPGGEDGPSMFDWLRETSAGRSSRT